jgi:hypothetical protein
MYELLTGRPPFEGSDDVQVLYQQLHDAPQPLSKFIASVPKPLQQLLDRALSKKPEDRFQSMREMALALDALDLGPPETGRDDTQSGRMRKASTLRMQRPELRKRYIQIGLMTGVLCLAAGFGAARFTASGAGSGSTALLLLSTPTGANIELDGKPMVEATPTSVRGLTPGSHSVKIRKGKMAVVERQVTLQPGERAVMNVVLPPASHPVEVHSAPEGASVYLDGKLAVGETPTIIDVSDDEFHELRVEKNGFENATRAITPDDHDPQMRISLTPEKQPRGTLMVDSNGAAEVWIDGVDSGYTTPTLGIHESVGWHTVEVRDASNQRAQSRVKIEQGVTTRLLLTPGGVAGAKPQ